MGHRQSPRRASVAGALTIVGFCLCLAPTRAQAQSAAQEVIPELPPPPPALPLATLPAESPPEQASPPAATGPAPAPPAARPPTLDEARDERLYWEGQPIPPGYELDSRYSRLGPLVAGATVFGSLYAMSTVYAASSKPGTGERWPLYVPVVGPFVRLVADESESESGSSGAPSFGETLLVLDGLGQLTGVILLGVGLASSEKILVRSPVEEVRDTTPRLTITGDRLLLEGRF